MCQLFILIMYFKTFCHMNLCQHIHLSGFIYNENADIEFLLYTAFSLLGESSYFSWLNPLFMIETFTNMLIHFLTGKMAGAAGGKKAEKAGFFT